MNRFCRLLFMLGLATGAVRAGTAEPLAGRLTREGDGVLVLTLDLDPGRLAHYADKAGVDAGFDRPALTELIRERFHYLLRWRSGLHEAAPTSIELAGPVADERPYPMLALTVKWRGLGNARGEVIAQSDSREYQLVLTIADERAKAAAVDAPPQSPLRHAQSVRDGLRMGAAQVIPGGVGQILFMLGLYFSGGGKRARGLRLLAFLIAHGLALAVGMSDVVQWPAGLLRGLEFAAGLSVVGLAVANCLGGSVRDRTGLALFAGAGLLHGFALAPALSAATGTSGGTFAGMLGALLAIEFILAAIAGAGALFRGALDRPEFAVPASVVVGFGGLAWTLECARGGFGFTP